MINTVALLQYQRPVVTDELDGEKIDYIEVTPEDTLKANGPIA